MSSKQTAHPGNNQTCTTQCLYTTRELDCSNQITEIAQIFFFKFKPKENEDIKNWNYNRRKKVCEKLRNRFAREASWKQYRGT